MILQAAIGVAFSLGFVIGPLLGAWFTNIFANQPYFYAAPAAFSFVITTIDILYVYKCLPETLPHKKRVSCVIVKCTMFFASIYDRLGGVDYRQVNEKFIIWPIGHPFQYLF